MHLRSLPGKFLPFVLGLAWFLGLLTPGFTGSGRAKKPIDLKPVRVPMLSITTREARFHVAMLASEPFQGRASGTPGQWLAAKYIATEFADFELEAAGDHGKFYQNFQIEQTVLKQTEFWTIESPTLAKTEFSYRADYALFPYSGADTLTAPIVFAGYGITAPEYQYDDYQGVGVQGKIVLVLRHEPGENDPNSLFNGRQLTRHALFEEKARNALNHGARALILVNDPDSVKSTPAKHGFWPNYFPNHFARQSWQIQKIFSRKQFPILWVSLKLAQKLLEHTGHSLKSLMLAIDRRHKPVSFEIPNRYAHIKIGLVRNIRQTQNVLARLQGSDPRLREQVVVVGAHFDHIGVVNGQIYPGADDNASGTAGLLEIAEAFSEMPRKPRRSVLFIAFGAEELGLLGSEYYVENPVEPLANTVAMLNLDMISRNQSNTVSIIGSDRSPELHWMNIAANEMIGLDLKYDGEKFFNQSDHANFAKHRIPVIFYNTNIHPDYHRATDLATKIDPEKLTRIARLAFLVAWEAANSEHPPTFHRFKIHRQALDTKN